MAETWYQALRRELAETVLTAQVAQAIVLYALGPDAPCPSVVLADLTAEELAVRRELVRDLISGQVVEPGEPWIRRYLGLPEKTSEAGGL